MVADPQYIIEVIFPAFCTYDLNKFNAIILMDIEMKNSLKKSFHEPSKNELVIGPENRTHVKMTGIEIADNKPLHLKPNKVRRLTDS